MRQSFLDFDAPPRRTIEDSNPTAPAAARPRLTRQRLAIVERLRRGPATNRELAAIALNYRARISELRQIGFAIACRDHDEATGHALYVLTYDPEATNG